MQNEQISVVFPIPILVSISLPVGFLQTLQLSAISTVSVIIAMLIVINKNERIWVKELIIEKINKKE